MRTHWAVFMLALTVASLTCFPQLIAEYRMGDVYQGIHPEVVDDQLYYLSRAHETLDGHPTLGNPYLYEHKDTPGVQFWIPDMALAKISMALGGLREGKLLFDFIFPALVVLLSYAIIFTLTRDRLVSLGFAAFVDPGVIFIAFLRTPHPQLIVLLFAALLALILSFQRRSSAWAFTAALIGGSLFYIYPFYWTYYVVMVALAIPASFIFLDRREGAYKKLIYILLGSGVLGIPYFLEMLRASRIPYYAESMRRIGVIETHFPSGFFIVVITVSASALVAWCWYKKIISRAPGFLLVACAALAGAVVVNQSVITGSNFFFTTHYTMFAQFMSIFAVAACAPACISYYVRRPYEQYARVALAGALICVSILHVAPQIMRLSTPQSNDMAMQRYGPILAWLDANTQTDDVVYANQTLSLYIPAYTRDNVFFSSYAQQAYLSQAEVNERYLAWHYFDGLDRQKIIDTQGDVFGAYYVGRFAHAQTTSKWRKLLGLSSIEVEQYPESAIAALVEAEKIMQEGTFGNAIQGYRVDYLVWDTQNDKEWRIPGTFTKLYESGGLIVYAVPNR